MIKIALAIIIVVLVGYLGYGIEKFYKTRLKILLDFKNFIKYAERETAFLKTNVDELVGKFENSTDELKKILLCALEKEEIKVSKVLNEQCKKEIISFINELSKSDFISIKSVIANALSKCDDMLVIAEKDKIQKGELSRKLVILFGIGLIIIVL